MRALLPFTSLDAVSAAGPGQVRDLECVARRHTVVSEVTGGLYVSQPMQVRLEGSLDGDTWVALATLGNTPGLSIVSVADHLVRYVRANVVSMGDGANPTVTAVIASAEE